MSLLDSLARPRTLGTLLAVSLALNLFLVGSIAGRISARGQDGPPPPMFGLGGPGMDSGFPFVPREGRERMRDLLHDRRPELRAEHEALRQLHRDIAAELARDAPDRALIEHRFDEIRAKTLHIEESLQGAFLDSALAMDTVARKRMLDAMQERRGRPTRHGGGVPHHGMPPEPPPAMDLDARPGPLPDPAEPPAAN